MLLLWTAVFTSLAYLLIRWVHMPTQSEITTQLGKVILFCGTETWNYTTSQWNNIATFCRAHKIDSVLVKVNDGGIWWYGGLRPIADIRNIFRNMGVGFIPYGYFYGNKYGAVNSEINIVQQCLTTFGYMCMDMEVEYDNDSVDAKLVASQLSQHQGLLLCSTWADPQLQNWVGILDILRGTFDAFMPQEYTNYLDSTEYQLSQEGIVNMIPTVYLGKDLVNNNPYQIAVDIRNRGHSSISLWYDEFAQVNPTLVDQIVALYNQPMSTRTEEDNMNKQFADVYAANPFGLQPDTGIAATMHDAFLAKKVPACFPTSKEIETVNWSGQAIKFQTFSCGVHAEYLTAEGHCYLYDVTGVKIWG